MLVKVINVLSVSAHGKVLSKEHSSENSKETAKVKVFSK
jgi:hypothetical protein